MVGSVTRLTAAVHSLSLRAIRGGGSNSEGGKLGLIENSWLGKIMGWNSSESLCMSNCSGHGECMNGTCFCEVKFDGAGCSELNVSYHVAFASVFLLVAATSLIQLLICIHAEYTRLKTPSLLRACRITNQKFLYILVFLAALLRGLYFAYPGSTDHWSSSLLSAFYPVLLTGASLIVCFWAEVFHIRDVQERPRFLSKSFLGFLAFNVITYSLLIAELVITNTQIHTEEDKSFFSHVFNGCYAVLMFIVVVFFLIYGVEVYFKVRGGFVDDSSVSMTQGFVALHPSLLTTSSASAACPSPSSSPSTRTEEEKEGEEDKDVMIRLMREEVIGHQYQNNFMQSIDTAQLNQSRLGLVSQALMLTITVCFLLSDVLGEFWKKKVPLESRNIYDIVFRVVELGVALWFPCVLWNCIRPEQLWLLNPKKILKRLDITVALEVNRSNTGEDLAAKSEDDWDKKAECWICYDSERTDAGPMIAPCACKGDVGAVHHECLKHWLIESANNPDASLLCKVCQTPYQVEKDQRIWSQLNVAVKPRHWLQTVALVVVMCSAIAGASAIIQLYQDSGIRMLAVGVALLIVYVCFRFLGLNTIIAYQRAKVSAFKIVDHNRNNEASNSTRPAEDSMRVAIIAAQRPNRSLDRSESEQAEENSSSR